MSNYYECPPAHDGEIKIYFDLIVMPYARTWADFRIPSCPSPKSYKHLQLVQKNLAYSGADLIKGWNEDNSSDAVIYLGKWDIPETELHL